VRVPSQLLRQHVTVRDRTEDLGDGAGYEATRRVRCRVDWKQQLMRGPDGTDITVVGTLLIRPETKPITVGAEVTIDGDARTAMAVTPLYGPGAKLAGRVVGVQ
jgi:hypothetical protein